MPVPAQLVEMLERSRLQIQSQTCSNDTTPGESSSRRQQQLAYN
jgi:hypothetical protein